MNPFLLVKKGFFLLEKQNKMYTQNIDIRWADLDPNFHVLHSKYYDFCAFARTAFLYENGITAEVMKELGIGPILFKEECIFKKEIRFGDKVTVLVEISGASQNFARWQMKHKIIVGEDVLAAQVTVQGAWMDVIKRKLTIPEKSIAEVFEKAPRSEDFKFL